MHIPLEKPISADLDVALNDPANNQIDLRDFEEPIEITNGNNFLKRFFSLPIPLFCARIYTKKKKTFCSLV